MFFFQWVLPELIGSAALTLLLLTTSHWWLLLFNGSMTIWLIYQLTQIPKTQSGLYDPNELLGKTNIQRHTRRSLFRIVFYLIQFLLFLYSMILSLLARHWIKNKYHSYKIVSLAFFSRTYIWHKTLHSRKKLSSF